MEGEGGRGEGGGETRQILQNCFPPFHMCVCAVQKDLLFCGGT